METLRIFDVCLETAGMAQSFWRLRHPGWNFRSLVWVRKFFCPQKCPDRLWTNSAYYSVSTGFVYSLGVKGPQRVIELTLI
jgi:hypothetical protein